MRWSRSHSSGWSDLFRLISEGLSQGTGGSVLIGDLFMMTVLIGILKS